MRSTCTQYRERHTIIEGGDKEPIKGNNAIVWWKNHENLFIFLRGGREYLPSPKLSQLYPQQHCRSTTTCKFVYSTKIYTNKIFRHIANDDTLSDDVCRLNSVSHIDFPGSRNGIVAVIWCVFMCKMNILYGEHHTVNSIYILYMCCT